MTEYQHPYKKPNARSIFKDVKDCWEKDNFKTLLASEGFSPVHLAKILMELSLDGDSRTKLNACKLVAEITDLKAVASEGTTTNIAIMQINNATEAELRAYLAEEPDTPQEQLKSALLKGITNVEKKKDDPEV